MDTDSILMGMGGIVLPVDRSPYARAAQRVFAAWGLTSAEGAALLRGDPERAHVVIGISSLLQTLYSGVLATQWMTIPNTNRRIGGSLEHPMRPVDYAISDEGGLEAVWDLLRGYAEGQ